jgi:hypothetical protein
MGNIAHMSDAAHGSDRAINTLLKPEKNLVEQVGSLQDRIRIIV